MYLERERETERETKRRPILVCEFALEKGISFPLRIYFAYVIYLFCSSNLLVLRGNNTFFIPLGILDRQREILRIQQYMLRSRRGSKKQPEQPKAGFIRQMMNFYVSGPTMSMC